MQSIYIIHCRSRILLSLHSMDSWVVRLSSSKAYIINSYGNIKRCDKAILLLKDILQEYKYYSNNSADNSSGSKKKSSNNPITKNEMKIAYTAIIQACCKCIVRSYVRPWSRQLHWSSLCLYWWDGSSPSLCGCLCLYTGHHILRHQPTNWESRIYVYIAQGWWWR